MCSYTYEKTFKILATAFPMLKCQFMISTEISIYCFHFTFRPFALNHLPWNELNSSHKDPFWKKWFIGIFKVHIVAIGSCGNMIDYQ